MGKKKVCPKCQLEIEDSKKQKMQRSITNNLLKSISSALPGIESTLEEAKPYCYKCYRKTVLTVVGPATQGLLDGLKEEDQEPEND